MLTKPPTWSKREILDGIFYQLKNGAHLGRPPQRPAALLHSKWDYKQWRTDGVIEQMRDALHAQVREQVKKNQHGQHSS